MNIQIKLIDSDCVEVEQSDIEDMWNYISEDTEDLIYRVTERIKSLDKEYWKDYLVPLYKTLKEICEDE